MKVFAVTVRIEYGDSTPDSWTSNVCKTHETAVKRMNEVFDDIMKEWTDNDRFVGDVNDPQEVVIQKHTDLITVYDANSDGNYFEFGISEIELED